MANIKPSIPQGTRDFGPEQVFRRQFIIQHIKSTFENFGFLPLETPTMENLSVLTGKYGDEGDQLLFKILNSGDYLSKTTPEDYAEGSKKFTPKISEKGLRYDLTVPFARYVVMNRNDITFPFKRYQIQPVWRADKPQKGRYREFYQCDADVIGTTSLLSEAEIILMIQQVFAKLGIHDYTVKVNSRKVLQGLAAAQGIESHFVALTTAIDKLDKIGAEKVKEELIAQGIAEKIADQTSAFLAHVSKLTSNDERFDYTRTFAAQHAMVLQGTDDEIKHVFDMVATMGGDMSKVSFDPTLARGLNYYTGCIFEVVVNNVQIGSVSGGGRYDNLTESFGVPDMSGVGFSFGLDRIYDVMTELELFPPATQQSTQVLIIALDEAAFTYGLSILPKFRAKDIRSELYPELVKTKKSMKYANNKNIPFVILIGSEELSTGLLTFKNMHTGEQQSLAIDTILNQL